MLKASGIEIHNLLTANLMPNPLNNYMSGTYWVTAGGGTTFTTATALIDIRAKVLRRYTTDPIPSTPDSGHATGTIVDAGAGTWEFPCGNEIPGAELGDDNRIVIWPKYNDSPNWGTPETVDCDVQEQDTWTVTITGSGLTVRCGGGGYVDLAGTHVVTRGGSFSWGKSIGNGCSLELYCDYSLGGWHVGVGFQYGHLRTAGYKRTWSRPPNTTDGGAGGSGGTYGGGGIYGVFAGLGGTVTVS